MVDICIECNDSTPSLALIGKTMGDAGVNIAGLCIMHGSDRFIIHFVVEEGQAARQALETAGIAIEEMTDVFVLDKDERKVTGRPGSFGEICRLFTQHNIQIRFGYPAENNRFVFGVDNIQKAQILLN